MPVPTASIYRPRLNRVDAALQHFAQLFTKVEDRDATPRSVADLLEFGYAVSQADRRFPHMPA